MTYIFTTAFVTKMLMSFSCEVQDSKTVTGVLRVKIQVCKQNTDKLCLHITVFHNPDY